MGHGFVSLPFFEVTEAARIIGITRPEGFDRVAVDLHDNDATSRPAALPGRLVVLLD